MFDWQSFWVSSITEPNRSQYNDLSAIGFDYRTFDWLRRVRRTGWQASFFKANNLNRYFEFCWPCRSLFVSRRVETLSQFDACQCLYVFLNHLTISAPANRSCNRLKYFVVKHWRGVNEQHVRRFVKQIEVSLKHKRRPPSLPTWCPRCTKVQGEYLHLSRSWFCQWETF